MKSLSTVLGAALLVGLAGLVVLSSPGGFSLDGLAIEPAVASAAIQEQPVEQAAEPLAAPDTTVFRYNDVALVLEVPGVTDAASLASYAGSWVTYVLGYDAGSQAFRPPYVVGFPSTNFPVATSEFVFLLVDEFAPQVLSLVGGVPEQGSVSFPLVSGSPPKFNFLSLPLEKGSMLASEIATDVGPGVVYVLRYAAGSQAFEPPFVPGFSATDFELAMGEPFVLVLGTGATASWP